MLASPRHRPSLLRHVLSAQPLSAPPALFVKHDFDADQLGAWHTLEPRLASGDPQSDIQLNLALDTFTNAAAFDIELDHPDDRNFYWHTPDDAAATVKEQQPHVLFDSAPFPDSPVLIDDRYVSPALDFPSYPRTPVFPATSPFGDPPFASGTDQPPAHVEPGLDIFVPLWNQVPDTGGSDDSGGENGGFGDPYEYHRKRTYTALGHETIESVTPLALTHRASFPVTVPGAPYSPPLFFHNSAPESYSPIRQYQRRYTTAGPGDDASARKRKRSTPELEGRAPARSELHPPKQAPSTWQVFFADWLEDHRARNPRQKLNVAQAAKEAGQVYHNLRADERERLKQRALAAKEDREREVAEWKRRLTPDDIKRENAFRAAQRRAGKSRKGNLKDPNAPKKPLSAYFMFLQKIRASPHLVVDVFGEETETTKQSVLAAAKWRSMSDEEKKPFLIQAEQEKIAYDAARRQYEDRASPVSVYRSSGEIGQDGASTSVLAYPLFAQDGATDDEGDASESLSDTPEEA